MLIDYFKNLIILSIILAVIQFSASQYNKHNNYLKITAFLWGAPLFFFFLLYVMVNEGGIQTILPFTKHAAIGTFLTVVAMFFTLYITHYSINTIVIINMLFLFLILFAYFYFNLYKI